MRVDDADYEEHQLDRDDKREEGSCSKTHAAYQPLVGQKLRCISFRSLDLCRDVNQQLAHWRRVGHRLHLFVLSRDG